MGPVRGPDVTDSDRLECREVYYRGRVQGVGFRYTARSVARRFDVVGFVRNLPDGRVQLVAEGTPQELDRFFAAIADHLGHYVHGCEQHTSPATGEFSGFEVRF